MADDQRKLDLYKSLYEQRERELRKETAAHGATKRAAYDLFEMLTEASEKGEPLSQQALADMAHAAQKIAGYDYCHICADEYTRWYSNEPSDGGICESCYHAECREIERTNRLNCIGTPYQY